MSSTPWRRGNVKLEVDASVEHVESASVPGGAPAAGTGKFWVRNDSDNTPMFTSDGGIDYVLNGGSQWQEETATTTDATANVTIATPVSALGVAEQTFVDVIILAESGAANTYFHRQLITYYESGGVTQWTVEMNGLEQRRGFPTTVTAALAINGSAIEVQATGQAATTINWTVQYRTKETVQDGLATGSGAPSPTASTLVFTSLVTSGPTTAAVNDLVKYDPSGGPFTINAPASPSKDDRFAIKNATADLTNITLSGYSLYKTEASLVTGLELHGDPVKKIWRTRVPVPFSALELVDRDPNPTTLPGLTEMIRARAAEYPSVTL